MFWKNTEDKVREEAERVERERLKSSASNKRRTDELMEAYYIEQKEKDLIAKAQEEDYKINRKRMYTLPHYDRLQIHEDTWIERVPGGWIFYQTAGKTQTGTFVPFTEEKIEMFYKLKNEK